LLHTPQAPQGIVNLQLAGNAAYTRDNIAKLEPATTKRGLESSLLLDFLMVALYSITLLLLTRRLLEIDAPVDARAHRQGPLGAYSLLALAARQRIALKTLFATEHLKEPKIGGPNPVSPGCQHFLRW